MTGGGLSGDSGGGHDGGTGGAAKVRGQEAWDDSSGDLAAPSRFLPVAVLSPGTAL